MWILQSFFIFYQRSYILPVTTPESQLWSDARNSATLCVKLLSLWVFAQRFPYHA